MQPLAITGYGVVSPIGIGRAAWAGALAGGDAQALNARAFGGSSTVLSPEKFPSTHAAEVWGFDAKSFLGDKGLRNFDRLTKYLIVAGKLALEDAGLKKDGQHVVLRPDQIGICSSTAYGSLDQITELNLVAQLEDPRYINPAKFPNTVINAAAGYVSIWEDLRAPNVTIVDGNCGSLDAVLTCETHLLHQRGDVFLVGGGEVLSEPLYLAIRALGVIAEGDSPFVPGSMRSNGTRVGEGAAYVVVEREAEARARGATIRARIAGYGQAFEPPRSEALVVHASADATGRAIRQALRDAELDPKDVDLVVGSLSGIQRFDAAEVEGIDEAIGPAVPIAAPKAIWGETFGAHGALATAAVLAWIEGAPPTPLVRGAAPPSIRNAVITTVGYYGNVSAIVLRAP